MLRNWDKLNQLQWLSTDELIARQYQYLEQLLRYANTYVPYYRDLFEKIDFHPSDFSTDPACFQELPLLTKDIVREHRNQLITTEASRQAGFKPAKTGGTTGEPLRFMRDQQALDYTLAHLYHIMEWSGWRLGRPQGWLWGHMLTWADSEAVSIVAKLKSQLFNRRRSNAFHMTPESMEAFAVWLERHPKSLVWSYVSTLCRFAQFVQDHKYAVKLRAAYTTAEPLYPHQREFIESVFDCHVFNTYSCVEMGQIACECDRHDGLHLMMRNCYLEVLRDGQPVSDGEEGEFVLTNLTNLAFPFIRYKLEDSGKKSIKPCPCGRGLPVLEVVQGRIVDSFQTKDGRRVWGGFILPMMPLLGKIKQYQMVQKTLDLIVFRIVSEEPLDESKFSEVIQACKIALGEDIQVTYEYVDSLPSTPTGKHRSIVSELV